MRVDHPGFIQANTFKQGSRRYLEIRRSLLVSDDDPWFDEPREWLESRDYEVLICQEYRDPGLMFKARYELYEEVR